jgi:hypothetical protein
MPDATKSLLTRGTLRHAFKSCFTRACEASRFGQTPGKRHESRGQVALLPSRQRIPYMFAVGPPTSLTVPAKSFDLAIRRISSVMDAIERDWMVLPW